MKPNSSINKDSIINVVGRHYPAAEAIYLFGSHAQGEAWPQSDVDIALLLPPADAHLARAMAASPCRTALTETLGQEVDLINLRLANTVFQNEIVHAGQRIFTAGEDAALAFEMQVLSAYQKLNEERKEILDDFLDTKRAYKV